MSDTGFVYPGYISSIATSEATVTPPVAVEGTLLVSIVINNFNYGRFLSEAIESALAQTHPRTEVIVVDDASHDGSQDIVRSFGSRVVPVLLESNRGQAGAFNAGFAKSQGEIVIFLDADDYLYPHAAARVAEAWVPGISKMQYRLDLVDRQGRFIDLYPAPEVKLDSGNVVPRLLATGRYQTVVTSGNAFSRLALLEVLPVPEQTFRMCADGYLVTVSPFHGPVLSSEEPLGAYRQHGDNAWGENALPLAERLRRSLAHDSNKYASLVEKAHRLSLKVADGLGLRDHHHLATRMGSLALDPENHPYSLDSRASLARRGFFASLDAPLQWKRRLVLAAWFLAVGFLPRRLARPVVYWQLSPKSRPQHVDRVLKLARRITR